MSSDGLITDLCERWEDARRNGTPVTPEDLCRDRPDLLPELRQAVQALEAADRRLAAGSTNDGSIPSPSTLPVPPGSPIDSLPASGQRYRATRFHARGGLGEVYEAHDPELDRRVALKAIRPERTGDSENQARFLREATVTARLEHPGVVPVYGLETDLAGRPAYAMRFVEGQTLADAVKQFHDPAGSNAADRGLRLRQLLTRFVAVCQTIAYAHSRGVVHRDLKPQNVMLGPFGETLVVDWGLAKVLDASTDSTETATPEVQTVPESDDLTKSGVVLGTPAFMAPEQAEGRPAGPAADVYALGAMLAMILTGRPPVSGASVPDVLDQVRRGAVVSPRQVNSAVPPPLEAICLTAMSHDPADRYESAAALAADVERWLADEPVSTYRDPLTVKARRWAKRHRPAVAGLAALLVAAVPLSIALALTSDRARRQAEADQERVEREKAEVVRQQERAEENLATADRLAGDVIDLVVENPRLKQAELSGARREILQRIAPVYERVAVQRAGDPRAAAAITRADLLLGMASKDLDRHADALAALRKAEQSLAERIAAGPTDLRAAADLGRARVELGPLLYKLGRREEAAAVLTAARNGLDAAARDPAAPAKLRLYQVRALNNLGYVLHGLEKLADADAAYTAALAACESLHRLPRDPEYDPGFEQGRALANHGLLLWDLRRTDEARVSLEKAVALHDEAARARPDLRSYRREAAYARASLSSLLLELGRREDALRMGEEARRAAEALVAEFPTVPEYQAALARVTLNHGELLAGAGAADQAVRSAEAAVATLRRLADRHTAAAEYAFQHATGLLVFGQILAGTGRADQARQTMEDACARLEDLVQAHPTNSEYRAHAAKSCSGLGNFFYTRQEYPAAERVYRRQLAWYEGLARDFPDSAEYRERVGTSAYNVGMAVGDQGRPADTLPLYTRAIDLLVQPVAANPDLKTSRNTLRNSYWGRADSLGRLGRHTEAVPDWRAALVLTTEPAEQPVFRLELAKSLLESGDRSAAAAEAATVAAHSKTTADGLVGAAGVVVAAAGPDDRERVYRTAVEWLGRARSRGLAAVKLRDDPRLAPLRDRDDFRKLLIEVEQASPMK